MQSYRGVFFLLWSILQVQSSSIFEYFLQIYEGVPTAQGLEPRVTPTNLRWLIINYWNMVIW